MQLVVKNRIINEELINILKDVQSQLFNGKLMSLRPSRDNIQVTCPFHADGMESRPSCFIYTGTENAKYGTFHCFTCGAVGSFAKFIGECFDRSEYWGEEWLISNYAVGYADIDDSIKLEAIHIDNTSYEVNSREATNNFLENQLNQFESYHPYMSQRKLTSDVVEKFNIKYDPKTKSIVFPVRDRYGNLIALTRRSVNSKLFHIDGNFDKKNVYALDKIQQCDTVVVVESQINCLTLWGWGYPSVCLFGAGTTKDQMNELNNTHVTKWILAYDNDPAGRKGAERFKRMIRDDVFVTDLIMPQGRDVNDLTKSEFEEILKKKENEEWML